MGRYSGDCGAGMSEYFCWRCVVVRGDGWRLDVLPLPDGVPQSPFNCGLARTGAELDDMEAIRPAPAGLTGIQ